MCSGWLKSYRRGARAASMTCCRRSLRAPWWCPPAVVEGCFFTLPTLQPEEVATRCSEQVVAVQGSAAAPSVRHSAADVARLRLKAAIKSAWAREAVARGVAAAKKADYALAHRHAFSAASLPGATAFLVNAPGALCPAPRMHVLLSEIYIP